MEKNISKWMDIAALLMFVSAVFHITDGKILLGVIFFGAGVCFAAAANLNRKKDHQEGKTK